MKKLFVCLLTVVFIAMLAGCFGEQAPPPEVKLDDLYGTWVFEKDNGDVITYTFSKNMKYTLIKKTSFSNETSYGKYSLDGNEITIEPNDVYAKSVHKITVFDGENMTWGDSTIKSEFKKTKKK